MSDGRLDVTYYGMRPATRADWDALRAERDAWKARAERLVEQLRIATEQLQAFSDQRQERYPGEMGTFAHDALIRMSVAEDALQALAEPQPPCPGYVPTGHVCERCGEAPENHSHERHVIRGEQPPAEPTTADHPWFAWLPPSASVHRQCCDRPQSEHPEGAILGVILARGLDGKGEVQP